VDEAAALGPNVLAEKDEKELKALYERNKHLAKIIKRLNKGRRRLKLKPLPPKFMLTAETLGVHADRWELAADQRLAHHLVAERLLKECGQSDFVTRLHAPGNDDAMRLVVLGAGGSGKSRVIASIREMFQLVGHPEWLALTAITGTAASLIRGQTLDSLLVANRRKRKKADIELSDSDYIVNVSGDKLKQVRFVIADEFSMLGHYHLHLLDQALHKGRGCDNAKLAYAGTNMVFWGDPFTFSPIGDTAAYKSAKEPSDKKNLTEHDEGNLRGASLWEQNTHTVRLRKQFRVASQQYAELLG